MKKLLSVIIMTAMLAACMLVPASANAVFPDMPSDHWAFSAVERLTAAGTIQGFEDGSFKPVNTVSRAEFVKMLGKSDVRFDKDFSDVAPDHWAYDYIMYSRLPGTSDGVFSPAEPITRGDVAQLLYTRYANGAAAMAPYSITGDASDRTAAAWAYNTGLMVGGDMINLRLADSLTRAEAAVLIVRAQDLDPNNQVSFVDRFSDDAYKNVYEGSAIFDTPYDAQGTITYEELSAAAIRFQYKYRNPAVRYSFDKLYDGEYAKHWSIITKYALDEKNIQATREEGTKSVTVEDAIAILTLGAMNNEFVSLEDIKADGKTYSEVEIKDASSRYAEKMSFAYNFGISLYRDGRINAKSIITKKELSCILMQYSLSTGAQMGYHCGYNAVYLPLTTRLDSSSYPVSKAYYPAVSEQIPNYVYDAPYGYEGEADYKPAEFVNSASMNSVLYTTPLMNIASEAYDKGSEMYIDFFPALTTCLGTKGDVLRAYVNVVTAYDGMKLSDVFNIGAGAQDRVLSAGDDFWCDIYTNQRSAVTLYLDYKLLTLEQIIE